jgi:hypothetical protein
VITLDRGRLAADQVVEGSDPPALEPLPEQDPDQTDSAGEADPEAPE